MHGLDILFIDNFLWFIPLTILFWIFNWLDYYLSKRGLKLGAREVNPVIRIIGLLPVKIVTTIVFPILGAYTTKWVLVSAAASLLAVCIWNLFQLKELRERSK